MNYAVIVDGVVSNLYVSDFPLNSEDVQTDVGQIGWSYANGVFTPPTPSQTAVQRPTILDQIAALEALQTPRMVREAQAGSTSTFPSTEPNFPSMTSAQALAALEAKIAALRLRLTS